MSEYIGSRISLISKSDIRYVGNLHEINSENSTVALEHVKSYGTEGRRNNEGEEIGPSDNIYEYIVFRGSDVKDLRIEEQPKQEPKPPQPPMPDDPAILGAARPPTQTASTPQQQDQPQQQHTPNFQQPPFASPYGPYPPFQGQRFGPQGGFPGGPGVPGVPGVPGGPSGPGGPGFQGFPGMPPYGAPPGWYPPPGQGFPPGPFSPPQPGQMPPPIGPPGQQQQPQPQGPQQQQPPPPIGPSGAKDLAAKPPQKVEADSTAAKPDAAKPSSKAGTPVPSGPAAGAKQPPPPPVESKPDVSAALAPATTTTGSATSTAAQTTSPQPSAATGKAPPTGPKNNRIVPAIPLGSNNQQPRQAPVAPLQSASANVPPKMTAASASQPVAAQAAALNYQNATQAATAAVAAAMAKLPPAPGQKAGAAEGSAMDNLTKKVAEMRADDRIRHGNKPGTGGFAHPRGGAQHRGRGAARGGMNKVEVPTTDYDFESANAKFNKQDLVKEAIATGSPLGDSAAAPNGSPAGGEASPTNGTDGEKTAGTHPDVVIPTDKPATYNKATSFFDNISSEMRDREEATSRRGAEFRSEERRKNMETFGQGSVDGYRQGYRGRGRGRGGGYRGGRGYGGRGRGGPTRGRGGMQQAGAANGGA